MKLGQLNLARSNFDKALDFHKEVISTASSTLGPMRVEIELLLHATNAAKYKTMASFVTSPVKKDKGEESKIKERMQENKKKEEKNIILQSVVR
jgi:hypothetical protein